MDGALFAPAEADAGAGILTVDLAAVRANYATLCRAHRGHVGAVVKADGYGLGAIPVARALRDAGCDTFFVAHAAEGATLRGAVPDATIAVLHGAVAGTEAVCVAHGLTPVLASGEQIARWRPTGAPAMVQVDTGMHRLGIDAAALADARDLNLTHILSHLISAERADDVDNPRQLATFREAAARLPDVPTSLANSAGIFLGPDYASDLARPGAALYGINPTPGRTNPMRPVVTLNVPILQVRDVPEGATVGYNATWRARCASRIAVAAAGYADGLFRALGNRGAASFDGRPVPLIGRVSMDLATFDVTGTGAAPGDPLTLIGPGRAPEDVAAEAGTIAYEILCALGRRYRRRYPPA